MQLNSNIGEVTVIVQYSRLKWNSFEDSESLLIKNSDKKGPGDGNQTDVATVFKKGRGRYQRTMMQACDIYHWPNTQTDLETFY